MTPGSEDHGLPFDTRWEQYLTPSARTRPASEGAVSPPAGGGPAESAELHVPGIPTPVQAAALDALGVLTARELPALASAWCDSGHQTPALAELAAVTSTDSWAVRTAWNAAKAALGIRPFTTTEQALECALAYELGRWRAGRCPTAEVIDRVLRYGRMRRLPEAPEDFTQLQQWVSAALSTAGPQRELALFRAEAALERLAVALGL